MQTELPKNNFKRALAANRKQAGFWSTLASPSAVEIDAGAGFDWVLLDMEHSPCDFNDIPHFLRASVGGTAEPIVRPPWNDPVNTKRLLDIGVRSFLFPMVQNAEEARRAVQSTRYPPDGIRGFAGGSRAAAYGRIPNYAKRAAEELCVLVQVETVKALDAIPEMAKIDGLDGIFIGPNDLASDMGFLGQANTSKEVHAMVREGLKRIKAAKKAAGLLWFNVEEAKQFFNEGFDFIAVGGDAAMLARGSEQLAAQFKTIVGR